MDRRTQIAPLLVCLVSLACAAGCHVTSRVDATLAGKTRHKLHKDQRMVLAPRLEITNAGRFRLVEPIMCKRDILVEQVTHRTTVKKPNLATVIVGILATAAGGVALLSALGDSSGVLIGGGLVGVGVGVPLVVGPFLGNTTTKKFVGVEMTKRGRDYQRCAARGVKVDRATLAYGSVRAHGSVAKDGTFSVRAFDLFDAFALHQLPAVEIDVTARGLKFRTMLSASTIASGRAGFFKSLNVDPRKQRLSSVPRPRADNLVVTKLQRQGRTSIEIRTTITNKGIGDAWGVRGAISSNNPEIDGRMVYVGHLPARASRTAAIKIELSTDKNLDSALISLLLLDHHGTTRKVPVKFRGPILNATFGGK